VFLSYLRYLCLLAHSGVQYRLCYVFRFVFLRLAYYMLAVSLIVYIFDCPFDVLKPLFSGIRVALSLAFRVTFVHLSFFFWSLYCLSFDLPIMITPLVS
jgi:hypothetical protein